MVSPDDFVTYHIPCNYIQLNGFSGRDEHHFLRRDNGELYRVRLNSSAELFETGTDRGHGAPLARCLSQWARCVAFGSSAPRRWPICWACATGEKRPEKERGGKEGGRKG